MPHVRHGVDAPRPLFVPFRAFVRIVPFEGKPQEYYKDMEALADRVESDLSSVTGVNIATPVAFTPQFGDHTARLTIVGFHLPTTVSKADRTDATFDFDNGIVSGQIGGPNMARTDPTTQTDADAATLKGLLEAGSSVIQGNIFKMEYASVVYGEGGRTFPG